MSKPSKDEAYSHAEAARRRDEVVRRMANTPPQPKLKSLPRQEKKKKVAGGKGRAVREH
jgi:hypothetical protein